MFPRATLIDFIVISLDVKHVKHFKKCQTKVSTFFYGFYINWYVCIYVQASVIYLYLYVTLGPFVFVPKTPSVELGYQCNLNWTLGRIKECDDFVGSRCFQDIGRSHPRCVCRPGYASRYDAPTFLCEGIDIETI